jgi:hypothetical protein
MSVYAVRALNRALVVDASTWVMSYGFSGLEKVNLRERGEQVLAAVKDSIDLFVMDLANRVNDEKPLPLLRYNVTQSTSKYVHQFKRM